MRKLSQFLITPPNETFTAPNIATFNNVFFLFFTQSRGINDKAAPANDIRSNSVSFTFDTSAGSFEWQASTKVNGEQNIMTVIRNINDLPLEKGNGVTQYQDPYSGSNHFRVKMYAVDKKLYCEIASELSLDKLSQKELAAMALFGPISIISGQNQITQQYWSNIDQYAGLAIQQSNPFFTFTAPP